MLIQGVLGRKLLIAQCAGMVKQSGMGLHVHTEIVGRGEHFVTVVETAGIRFRFLVGFPVPLQLGLRDKPPFATGIVAVKGF